MQYQIMESDWGSGTFPLLAKNGRERGYRGERTKTKELRKRSRQCTPLQADSDQGTLPHFNHNAHPKPSKLPNPPPHPRPPQAAQRSPLSEPEC